MALSYTSCALFHIQKHQYKHKHKEHEYKNRHQIYYFHWKDMIHYNLRHFACLQDELELIHNDSTHNKIKSIIQMHGYRVLNC